MCTSWTQTIYAGRWPRRWRMSMACRANIRKFRFSVTVIRRWPTTTRYTSGEDGMTKSCATFCTVTTRERWSGADLPSQERFLELEMATRLASTATGCTSLVGLKRRLTSFLAMSTTWTCKRWPGRTLTPVGNRHRSGISTRPRLWTTKCLYLADEATPGVRTTHRKKSTARKLCV